MAKHKTLPRDLQVPKKPNLSLEEELQRIEEQTQATAEKIRSMEKAEKPSLFERLLYSF